MLCIIASSDVLNCTICSHYPGQFDQRVETVLNTCIHQDSSAKTIDIMWVHYNDSNTTGHNPNHFVPLFYLPGKDYKTKTCEKIEKQTEISKKIKDQFVRLGINTKKGKSINFNLKSKTIQHWFPSEPNEQNIMIPQDIHKNESQSYSNDSCSFSVNTTTVNTTEYEG